MQKGCMPPVKRYMTAIAWRLRVDVKTRVRIMSDLSSDFQNRRDAGLTDEQIMAELGTPAQVAAEFNAAFADEHGPYKSPWRWLMLALAAVVPAVLLVVYGPVLPGSRELSGGQAAGVGIIGGADGPTAIYVTSPVNWSALRSVFPWTASFLSAFLLLGWCRAGRRRLWLPMLLCGTVVVWQLAARVTQVALLASAGADPVLVLAGAVRDLLLSGGLLCVVLLALTIRRYRRGK